MALRTSSKLRQKTALALAVTQLRLLPQFHLLCQASQRQ
jgi:hypothetical protein